jgi:hypothetical protein
MKLQKNKLKHWFIIIAGKKGNAPHLPKYI